MPLLVAAPDKLRGTATAAEAARAMGEAAARAGWSCVEIPLSDGGEGFLDVMPGNLRRTRVTFPLGRPVEARWRLDGRTAYLEAAEAAGLVAAGGPEGNDPMGATTAGVGELIGVAVAAGARRVVLGVGGSATTDGGLGAIEALGQRSRGVELVVACDVRTTFIDAARTFAPQKGASPAQVTLLERRLERLAQLYLERHGSDVADVEGSGAGGGLAGGLAAVAGAELVPGFDLVAEATGLDDAMVGAELVVTAEGFVDSESMNGKVVGGVVDLASAAGVEVIVVAGDVYDEVEVDVRSLVERFGPERARTEAPACIEEVVFEELRAR